MRELLALVAVLVMTVLLGTILALVVAYHFLPWLLLIGGVWWLFQGQVKHHG